MIHEKIVFSNLQEEGEYWFRWDDAIVLIFILAGIIYIIK